MKTLPTFSFGIGDRFGLEGEAQLAALEQARHAGVEVAPVWNKSNREHLLTGTTPDDVRREADEAVRRRGWLLPHFVDADHIGLATVDRFVESSDFFTLDVADFIGRPPEPNVLEAFVKAQRPLLGRLRLPGIEEPWEVTEAAVRRIGETYLEALREAARIHRHIRDRKTGGFVVEISTDEAATAQTPLDLLFILSMAAGEGIPVQTIAPKFSGRFNKGVDYAGDVERFALEFELDLAAIRFAVDAFGLPPSLKLSIHSGSDKFSLYPVMRRALEKFSAGIHLKTAGTTWLEELAGLAESGGAGLALARGLFREAHARRTELCGPYATVIDIDPARLPAPEDVDDWSGERFVRALAHEPGEPLFNPHLRQLLHVGYKVAAERREEFETCVRAARHRVSARVTDNLYRKHLALLFPL